MGIRPIVSSVNSVTENISSFVDGWLNPLVRKLPSYLKDSSEFIKLITSTRIPQNSILVSVDVSSLYTNIPHKDGIAACAQALQADIDPDPLRPPTEILVEMLNIVLKNNVIEFNNEFFLQLQGTAMGTKMAPAYANLFMGSIEDTLQNIDRDHINTWKRFIDDIFVIWTGSQAQLTTFITQINQVHETIKFTYEQSNTELTFLDVTVYKGPNFEETGILDVKTHIKPTNKQLYVHNTSYHPKCTKTAIPKGEIQRYLRSNTREDTFKHIVKQLKLKLIERGYKAKDITPVVSAYTFDRREEIMSPTESASDKAPLVLPVKYGPLSTAIREILSAHWPEINDDEFLQTIFEDRPIVANKKNKNLANILVRSKVVSDRPNRPLTNSRPPRVDPMPTVTPNVLYLFNNTKPMKRCGNNRCTVCPRLLITNSIHVRKLNYNVRLPAQTPAISCCTKRVVYVIKCKVHHKAYVGQTGNMIRVRVNQHLAKVKSFKRNNMSCQTWDTTSMGATVP